MKRTVVLLCASVTLGASSMAAPMTKERAESVIADAVRRQEQKSPGYGDRLRRAAYIADRFGDRKSADSLLDRAISMPESFDEGLAALAMRGRMATQRGDDEAAATDMELLRALVVAIGGETTAWRDVYSSLNVHLSRLLQSKASGAESVADAILLLTDVSFPESERCSAVLVASNALLPCGRVEEATSRALSALSSDTSFGAVDGMRGSFLLGVVGRADSERGNAAFIDPLRREWTAFSDSAWAIDVGFELAKRLGRLKDGRAQVAVLEELLARLDKHEQAWRAPGKDRAGGKVSDRDISAWKALALSELSLAESVGLPDVAMNALARIETDPESSPAAKKAAETERIKIAVRKNAK